jgi:hypothetical protein
MGAEGEGLINSPPGDLLPQNGAPRLATGNAPPANSAGHNDDVICNEPGRRGNFALNLCPQTDSAKGGDGGDPSAGGPASAGGGLGRHVTLA